MTPLRLAAASLVAITALLGCRSVARLFEAREQVERLPSPCFLRGTVESPAPDSEVFVVAVSAADARPVDFHAGRGRGGWWLGVPPGHHRVAAFADLDGDRKRGPAEPAGLGEIASLDDERFSLASGERGLWAPIDFMRDPGGGLFLLEEYDPKRLPVLFVHGIAGGASQFRELIAGLDRTRFQARSWGTTRCA